MDGITVTVRVRGLRNSAPPGSQLSSSTLEEKLIPISKLTSNMVAANRGKVHPCAIRAWIGRENSGGRWEANSASTWNHLHGHSPQPRVCSAEPSCRQGGQEAPSSRWWGSSPSAQHPWGKSELGGAHSTKGAPEPERGRPMGPASLWGTSARALYPVMGYAEVRTRPVPEARIYL